MKKSFFVLFAVCGMIGLQAAEVNGEVLISDDFNADTLNTELWKPTIDAKKINATDMTLPDGALLRLKSELPENCVVECKFRIDKVVKLDWSGLNINGNWFTVRTDGKAFMYVIGADGKAKSVLTAIEGFEVGKMLDLRIVCEKEGDAIKYTYSVNGKEVASFPGKIPAKTSLFIAGRKAQVTVDDFTVKSLKK